MQRSSDSPSVKRLHETKRNQTICSICFPLLLLLLSISALLVFDLLGLHVLQNVLVGEKFAQCFQRLLAFLEALLEQIVQALGQHCVHVVGCCIRVLLLAASAAVLVDEVLLIAHVGRRVAYGRRIVVVVGERAALIVLDNK